MWPRNRLTSAAASASKMADAERKRETNVRGSEHQSPATATTTTTTTTTATIPAVPQLATTGNWQPFGFWVCNEFFRGHKRKSQANARLQ
ncbi:hypothetical protein ACLKA7_004407 [Drosophila subpalustris]